MPIGRERRGRRGGCAASGILHGFRNPTPGSRPKRAEGGEASPGTTGGLRGALSLGRRPAAALQTCRRYPVQSPGARKTCRDPLGGQRGIVAGNGARGLKARTGRTRGGEAQGARRALMMRRGRLACWAPTDDMAAGRAGCGKGASSVRASVLCRLERRVRPSQCRVVVVRRARDELSR